MVDEVMAIDVQDLQRAKTIVLGATRLSARDALHVAVMERHAITRILTFDADYDAVPGVTRIYR